MAVLVDYKIKQYIGKVTKNPLSKKSKEDILLSPELTNKRILKRWAKEIERIKKEKADG